MGVGKEYAAGGEAIKVRGDRLRMSAQATDPVIEIVDRDEQDVGSVRRQLGGGGEAGREKGEGSEEGFHGETV